MTSKKGIPPPEKVPSETVPQEPSARGSNSKAISKCLSLRRREVRPPTLGKAAASPREPGRAGAGRERHTPRSPPHGRRRERHLRRPRAPPGGEGSRPHAGGGRGRWRDPGGISRRCCGGARGSGCFHGRPRRHLPLPPPPRGAYSGRAPAALPGEEERGGRPRLRGSRARHVRAGWRLPEAHQAPGGLRGGRGVPALRAHAAAAAAAPPLRLPRGSAPRSTPRLPPAAAAAAAAALRDLRGLCPMWQEAMMMRRRRRYLLERAEQAGGGCGASGEQSRSRDWLYESYYCMSQQHPLIVFLLLIVMGACLALLAVFFASGLVRDALPLRDPLHPRVPRHPRCRRPASPLRSPRWHRRTRRSQPRRTGRDGTGRPRTGAAAPAAESWWREAPRWRRGPGSPRPNFAARYLEATLEQRPRG